MKAYHRFFVLFTCCSALLLSAAASHSYTITANAEGVGGGISPAGPVAVAAGHDQSFSIAPDTALQDVRVDGISVGPVSSYTFTNVSADHSIVASFACNDPATGLPFPPVVLDTDGMPYSTVTEAYNAAVDASLVDGIHDFNIMLMAGTLPEEPLTFDADISVMLTGGYDCSFQNNTMLTTLPGSLTITAGTVIPANLAISAPPACQPGDPDNFIGNPEICDQKDNNCNGLIDEGLSFDADGDGYTSPDSCAGSRDDCDDHNAGVHPGAGDIVGDGIDQNCDGLDPLTLSDANCLSCHDGTFVIPYHVVATPDGTCVGCHSPQVNNILTGHFGLVVITGNNDNGIPAGSIIGCVTCHDSGPKNFPSKITAAGGIENATCDTCHENRAAAHDAAHNNRVILELCSHCHTSDTTTLGLPGYGTLTSQADVDTLHRSDCYTSATAIPPPAPNSPDPAIVAQAIEDGINGAQISCTDCHTAHHESGEVHYDPVAGYLPEFRAGLRSLSPRL